MKKLKRRSIPGSTAAAILAGGLLFSGPTASAAVVFTEDFEGATNQFGMPTYAYADNYTQPNALTPAGGLNYAHGGAGVSGGISFNDFGPIAATLLVDGVDTILIDAGQATYNFYGQFSTYLGQNDFAEISLTFKDGANADIGAPLVIGGEAFVAALDGGGGARAWGADSLAGTIPVGARSVSISLRETKSAGGTVIDGYVDNVQVSAQAVPEPGAAALLCGSMAGWLLRRRRR